MASGYSASNNSYIVKLFGRIVIWQIGFGSNADMAAGAAVTVGTVPEDFKPKDTALGFGSTSAGQNIYCAISTSGAIRVAPSVAVGPGTSKYLGGVYYLQGA